MQNITTNSISSNLSEFDLSLLRNAYNLRVYVTSFLDIFGGMNNIIIILIVDFFDIFQQNEKIAKNSNQLINSSGQGNSSLGNKQNERVENKIKLELSRSAKIYFSTIAFFDAIHLWSAAFQRGWVRDISPIDPISISSISCRIYQFCFNYFWVTSSW